MKQLNRVPFERNSESVNTSVRRRGRNIIGHRDFLNVPGQRDGNNTMCPAITQNGVLHCHANLGPYNMAHILTDRLHNIITAEDQMDAEQMRYIVIWDKYLSTDLLWSKTGFISIHNFHSNTSHHRGRLRPN
ncbi:hypothetical protein N1851_033930 [Merluccius polli]|uniref:Uncharacterized protein n=1 Tax=Merluccius polli TaxID=89951 RepID=A0AA47M0M2_MERPO|nr:hypothetical protein N1851_033930 [Merluccius polli]